MPQIDDDIQTARNKLENLRIRMKRARALYFRNLIAGKTGVAAQVSFEETSPASPIDITTIDIFELARRHKAGDQAATNELLRRDDAGLLNFGE